MYRFSVSLLFFITLSTSKLFVSLTFDDCLIEHYDTSLLLNSYGMLGTFYINSGRVNFNGRLSSTQILQMQSNNHEIGGHTISHQNLTSLDYDGRLYQICKDRESLTKITGRDVDSFAYPFGATFENASALFQTCNYLSARTSGGIETPFDCFGCPKALKLPVVDPYMIRSITYRLTNGLTYFTTPIQTALKAFDNDPNFYWITLIFHEINDSSNSYTAISKSDFTSFLKWLKNRPTVGIVKMNEVIKSGDYEQLYNLATQRTNSIPIPSTDFTSTPNPTNTNNPTTQKPTNTNNPTTQKPTNNPTNNPTVTTDTIDTTSPTSNVESKLDTSSIIGISIGTVGFCSLAIIGILLFFRRHRIPRNSHTNTFNTTSGNNDSIIRISELDANDIENFLTEVSVTGNIPNENNVNIPNESNINVPNESNINIPNESNMNVPNESNINTPNEDIQNEDCELPIMIENSSMSEDDMGINPLNIIPTVNDVSRVDDIDVVRVFNNSDITENGPILNQFVFDPIIYQPSIIEIELIPIDPIVDDSIIEPTINQDLTIEQQFEESTIMFEFESQEPDIESQEDIQVQEQEPQKEPHELHHKSHADIEEIDI